MSFRTSYLGETMHDDAIMTSPSDSDLASAVEANLFALFRTMSASFGGELMESPGVSYHLAFPSNGMFKGAWRTHLSPDEADAAIEATIAWFRARQAPFMYWWTGLNTSPRDLGERLIARGFLSIQEVQRRAGRRVPARSGMAGMVADLQKMDEAALTQLPVGFQMAEVRHEQDLYAFRRAFMESYGIPEETAHGWVAGPLKVGVERMPWRMYLGWLDGKPVATSLVLLGAGYAGVYAVGTVPSARGKGIGGAITLKGLLDARQAGYRYGTLFATEMGAHAYQRIGFRPTGVTIDRYLWRNE